MGIAESSDAGKGKQGQGKRGETHGLVCHVLGTGQGFHVPLGPSQGAECLSCLGQAWWVFQAPASFLVPGKLPLVSWSVFPRPSALFPPSPSPTTKHSSNQRSLPCGSHSSGEAC